MHMSEYILYHVYPDLTQVHVFNTQINISTGNIVLKGTLLKRHYLQQKQTQSMVTNDGIAPIVNIKQHLFTLQGIVSLIRCQCKTFLVLE